MGNDKLTDKTAKHVGTGLVAAACALSLAAWPCVAGNTAVADEGAAQQQGAGTPQAGQGGQAAAPDGNAGIDGAIDANGAAADAGTDAASDDGIDQGDDAFGVDEADGAYGIDDGAGFPAADGTATGGDADASTVALPNDTPVGAESPLGIGFVYVDKAPIAVGDTQNIALVMDGDATLLNANLTYVDPQGALHAVGASALAGNAALFTFPVDAEGTWTLASLEYNLQESDGSASITYALDFTADGSAACTFEAHASVSATAANTDSLGAASFYGLDADGNVVEYGSLAEAAAAEPQLLSTRAAGEFVIALDPGHGAGDSGASNSKLVEDGLMENLIEEKDLTWAITGYCKEALERYDGVRVILTRSEDECPEIKERVQRAYDQGANVVVSIHINSDDSGSASGAEVWYPSVSSWKNAQTNLPGSQLAQNVLDKLTALGLNDRGIQVRLLLDPENESQINPDGSTADYYGIIRYSRKQGIVGIIVEHAFISNWSDAQLLASEEVLRAMGEADAAGIAQTYGLGQDTTALFGDALPGSWYVDEGWIAYVVENGLMTGVKDADGIARNFYPEESLTRGQLATILYRAANPDATDTTVEADYALDNGFSDTPVDAKGNKVGAYYNAAVKWCAEQGIVTGYTDGPDKGKFLPDKAVSREELATMAYRFAQVMGVDVAVSDTTNFDAASDTADVDDYAHDAMVWCAARGVMTGYHRTVDGAPTLEPQGSAERAAAAKVVTVLFRDVLGNA